MARAKFKMEWHAKEVLREIAAITEAEERAAAERVYKRARRYVPVGNKIVAKKPGRKIYHSRHPGRLRRSIKLKRSQFPDGGWLVFAGNELAYYARWVEYGTVFMSMRKGYKYMRKSLALEKSRFTRQLRKKLGV